MKVIVDKSERLWKAPFNLRGAMKFTERRLQARDVSIINLDSFIPEKPENLESFEEFAAFRKSQFSGAPSVTESLQALEKLKSCILRIIDRSTACK